MLQKMKKIGIISVILILFGCNSNNKIPDFSSEINYAYKTIQYSGNQKENEIISYKYFDNNEKLLEQIGKESRTKYFYNEIGKLKEKLNCRIYNCDIGWREILIYDNNNNYIGSKYIPKKFKNVNPRKFEQIKFYNKNNNIIKELSDSGTDVEGNIWEEWKFYYYEKGKIVKEIEKHNDKIIWTGIYEYDENNNLVSIKRKNKLKYENELFQYDKSNRLIKQSIENEEILNENVSFSVKNNSTSYKYDKIGRLIEEITFNHKGKEYRHFTNEYILKE
jgi:hypothetical protein